MAMRQGVEPPKDVCAIYARVSSRVQDEDDKTSLDDQEQACRAYAGDRLRILYVQKDVESASILVKRARFQRILDAAKAGRFGVLLIDRMNRLVRGMDPKTAVQDYMALKSELNAAGVRLAIAEMGPSFGDGPFDEIIAVLQAAQSGSEQENRIKAVRRGMRGRAITNLHPLPGVTAPFGYVWADEKKTRLAFDPGPGGVTMRRMWDYFLHDPHPTQRRLAHRFNDEGVQTPRAARGIKTSGGGDPKWYSTTISVLLNNPVYWGEPVAFASSKFEDQPATPLPAYGPAYVTPEDARRVHARLAVNRRHAGRPPARDWGTLLSGGLAKCAYCHQTLGTWEARWKRHRDDSRPIVYRCPRHVALGKEHGCHGVSILAESLDAAVIDVLNEHLATGEYLKNLFAAWDRDAELAFADVRAIEQDSAKAQQKVDNATDYILTHGKDDPLADSVALKGKLAQHEVDALTARKRKAEQAVTKARNNASLVDELNDWFTAWLVGFEALSRARQRQFLDAVDAHVELWAKGDRIPQAQLVIKLPTSAAMLPQPPGIVVDADGAWRMGVDTAAAARLATYVHDTAVAVDRTLAELGVAPITPDALPATAADVMAAVQEELALRGEPAPTVMKLHTNA